MEKGECRSHNKNWEQEEENEESDPSYSQLSTFTPTSASTSTSSAGRPTDRLTSVISAHGSIALFAYPGNAKQANSFQESFQPATRFLIRPGIWSRELKRYVQVPEPHLHPWTNSTRKGKEGKDGLEQGAATKKSACCRDWSWAEARDQEDKNIHGGGKTARAESSELVS